MIFFQEAHKGQATPNLVRTQVVIWYFTLVWHCQRRNSPARMLFLLMFGWQRIQHQILIMNNFLKSPDNSLTSQTAFFHFHLWRRKKGLDQFTGATCPRLPLEAGGVNKGNVKSWFEVARALELRFRLQIVSYNKLLARLPDDSEINLWPLNMAGS